MKTALLLLCAFGLVAAPMAVPSADAHVCVQAPGGNPCACPPDNEDTLHVHVNLHDDSCANVPRSG